MPDWWLLRFGQRVENDNYRNNRTCAIASVSECVIVSSEPVACKSAARAAAPP
jgi:hypothetical protein